MIRTLSPPEHPSCRCVLIPVTELTDLGEDMPRPAANADFDAEAKRMYEEKYPEKRFEELAPSPREQYRHKGEGVDYSGARHVRRLFCR